MPHKIGRRAGRGTIERMGDAPGIKMTDVDDARFKFLVLSLINDTIARGTSQLGRLEPPEMEAISLMKKYQVERMVIGPHEVRLATRSQVCAGVETPLESRLRFQKL